MRDFNGLHFSRISPTNSDFLPEKAENDLIKSFKIEEYTERALDQYEPGLMSPHWAGLLANNIETPAGKFQEAGVCGGVYFI